MKMPDQARKYAGVVIVAGALTMTAALLQWSCASPGWLAIFAVFTAVASVFKFRLPGLTGTYSANAVFVLIGVVFYSLPETVVVISIGTLIQQLVNTKRRPTLLQVAFNLANEGLSVFASFYIAHTLLDGILHSYRPAVLVTGAAAYFLINTVIVSGILAILEGRSLGEVCREWYYWSFPYYLLGVAVVAVLPGQGQGFHPEAWVALIPLAYLVHFFWVIPSRATGSPVEDDDRLRGPARVYVAGIMAAGGALTLFGITHWDSGNLTRFAALLILAGVTATWKVRLPNMTGTVSVTYAVTLFAMAGLSFGEVALISATGALVQTVWKAKRRASLVQIAFNCASFVVSSAVAFALCRLMLDPLTSRSLIVMLCVGASVLYLVNSVLVAVILCLIDDRPLLDIWQLCNFWVLPYYMAGTTAVALMIASEKAAGWPAALAVIPLLALLWTSYREHMTRIRPAAGQAIPSASH